MRTEYRSTDVEAEEIGNGALTDDATAKPVGNRNEEQCDDSENRTPQRGRCGTDKTGIVALIHRMRVGTPNDPKLSDGGHEARRLQLRRPAAVRCSAWLGVSVGSGVRTITIE